MLPEEQHPLLDLIRHALRLFLAVARVEPRNDLAREFCRLDADLAVAVHKELVKEAQSLFLLGVTGVIEVLPDHI